MDALNRFFQLVAVQRLRQMREVGIPRCPKEFDGAGIDVFEQQDAEAILGDRKTLGHVTWDSGFGPYEPRRRQPCQSPIYARSGGGLSAGNSSAPAAACSGGTSSRQFLPT